MYTGKGCLLFLLYSYGLRAGVLFTSVLIAVLSVCLCVQHGIWGTVVLVVTFRMFCCENKRVLSILLDKSVFCKVSASTLNINSHSI